MDGRDSVKLDIGDNNRRLYIMEKKSWYKSKTIWAALITGVTAIIDGLGLLKIPNEVYVLLGSLGLYGLRTGDRAIA